MSHFYGWLQGNRGTTTRGGSKNSGITATIQSWQNKIIAHLHDEEGKDAISLTIPKGVVVFINGKKRRV